MIIMIYIFGVLLVLLGFLIFINLGFFISINKYAGNLWAYAGRIILGSVFGGLLIYSSSFSKFPLAISILGWVIVIAAVILLAIGRENFEKLVVWVISIFKPFGRIGGLFSVGIGSFLIYAFI